MIAKLKRSAKDFIYSIVPPPRVPESYSQAGEDAILRFLFDDKGMSEVSYLDIGTNVPDIGNNSFLFYKTGSRGVCVEADKALIAEIERVRPEDTVLNFGVTAGIESEAEFYVFDLKGVSTFDREEAEKRQKSGKNRLVEKVSVPLIDINSLIENYFKHVPDLLSLDIEGLDLEVLKSMDFEKYPVPVICVETCIYSENHIREKDPSIAEFMLTQGYEIYADTYVNTIFVRKSWFYAE